MASSVRSSQENSAPELDLQTDSYAKVSESRGKGQFLVTLPDASSLLVYMPPKFRNSLWIRRGSFVIIRRYPDDANELMHVLSTEQIKEIKKGGGWPNGFINPMEEIEHTVEMDLETGTESEEY